MKPAEHRNASGPAAIPDQIANFLLTPTPGSWLAAARERLPELLIDHANCELKAASTALGFIYRYPEQTALCWRMSRVAREELRHFEQVRTILDERGIPFRRLTASRYAGGLRAAARTAEPDKLADLLIIGALIEARSCERFAALAPLLPADIGRFYKGLLASEARHFERYVELAREMHDGDAESFDTRLSEFLRRESELINTPDPQFRFHSGVPACPTG